MTYMNWTYGYDWEAEYMSEEAIADIMINTELLNPGANLLMHDREWTKDALADIVQGLRDKGYDLDRKSTRLNSSHVAISYAVFCLKKKNNDQNRDRKTPHNK